MSRILGFAGFIILLLASCAKEVPRSEAAGEAEHFSISYGEGYKVLSVKEAWNGDAENHRWLLLDAKANAADIPDSLKHLPAIRVPVERAVVLGTTAIAFMERLNLLDKIIAVESRSLIYSEEMQRLMDSLDIKQVGSGNALDLERLLVLSPDIVLTFGTGSAVYDDYPRLKAAKLPALLIAEWMENHPMARCEWLRFFGVLFGKEKEADSIFNEIHGKYNSLAKLASASLSGRPMVLTGYPQGSEWLAGGGNSYFARFLADAGAEYVWAGNVQTGLLTLGVETALQKGMQAAFWLHPSLWASKAEIMRNEPRMAMLPLWQSGKIYQSSKRTGKNGSRDFYESGVANPDLVLADLIFIFHPEVLPGHKFVYYETVE
jgi:iron complex transport system substrate-binding protein